MPLTSTAISRLKSQLITTGLNQKNLPLFQVIDQLIDFLKQLQQDVFGTQGTSGVVPGGPGGISNSTFITSANETASLPNSRQLIAGSNVTIDTSTPGLEKISASITQTTIIKTNQPVTIGNTEIEIKGRNGKLIIKGSFKDSQIGKPVFISQVPNRESDMVFIQFIGEILDTRKMRIFWQAPFGAPRKMQINYLIGA